MLFFCKVLVVGDYSLVKGILQFGHFMIEQGTPRW